VLPPPVLRWDCVQYDCARGPAAPVGGLWHALGHIAVDVI
jgi:hypothetical protein